MPEVILRCTEQDQRGIDVKAKIPVLRKTIQIVPAHALNTNGTLNTEALDSLPVKKDQEVFLDRETFNHTLQFYRGHFEKRLTPEHVIGKEKAQTPVHFEVGGEEFETATGTLAGQGVGATRLKKLLAFRKHKWIATGTVVGVGTLESHNEKILKSFRGVGEKRQHELDADDMVASIKIQQEDGTGMPTAVNIMAAAEAAPYYTSRAIDAGVKIVFCGAGNPQEVTDVFVQKIKNKETVKTGLAPIFNDARSFSTFMARSIVPFGVETPIVQFENPAKAGGHEGGDEYDFDTDKYDQNIAFFDEIKEAIEDLAQRVESGKLKLKVEHVTKEEVARRIRNIKIMVSGGVNTHEEYCRLLASGADMVGFGTSADNMIPEESDADDNFARIQENGFKGHEISDDTLHTRRNTFYKSTAGYPAQTVWSPFVEQMMVLNEGMKLVWDAYGFDRQDELTKLWSAEKEDSARQRSLFNEKIAHFSGEVFSTVEEMAKKLYGIGKEIPGWHFEEGYFINLIQGKTFACASKCLKECGPTTHMYKMLTGKKKRRPEDPDRIIPTATKECILGPLTKAYHADGITYWPKMEPLRNIDIGLFFTGSEAPALRRTSTENFIRYMTTGEFADGVILNPVKSFTGHEFRDLWAQKPEETIAHIQAL